MSMSRVGADFFSNGAKVATMSGSDNKSNTLCSYTVTLAIKKIGNNSSLNLLRKSSLLSIARTTAANSPTSWERTPSASAIAVIDATYVSMVA
jgi:hypothetical protein